MGALHYFSADLTGLAAASLLAILLILVPGFGIAKLGERAGLIGGDPLNIASWSLLLSVAILPALDALLLRWLGFRGVLAAHVAVAILGAPTAMKTVRRIPPLGWLAILACFLFAAWANVDFDWRGRLNQSLTIIDTVKHAAVVAQLSSNGLPLHDPFFARDAVAGYYYYFYLSPALIHWLAAPLIDARAAFGGATFVILLAFPAMLFRTAAAARLIPDDRSRAFLGMLLLLCCVSGFDLLPAIGFHEATGYTLRQLDRWDEEVRWVLTSILWVPHHLAAVTCIFTGCLLLATADGQPPVRAGMAGIAFASAFGCSVWVAVAAVPVLAAWWIWELKRRNSAVLWTLPLSGTAALILLLPQFADLVAGRAGGAFPLGIYVRSVGPLAIPAQSLPQMVWKLALVPGAYFIEFGLFSLGAIAYLRRGGFSDSCQTAMGRLLLVAAPVGLLLATFVRSTIIYNDFGWRCIWFTQVPALLWTAALLCHRGQRQLSSPVWAGALALGLCATGWDMAGLRLMRPPEFKVPTAYVNRNPDVDYDVRGTYRWIDRNLPAAIMVQHNPNLPFRALEFGLYSDRGVPVSDIQGTLFGARPNDVQARLSLVQPIFKSEMPLEEVRRRALAAGAGAILLTASDPLWRAAGGPPRSWPCGYRSRNTCVMLVRKLG